MLGAALLLMAAAALPACTQTSDPEEPTPEEQTASEQTASEQAAPARPTPAQQIEAAVLAAPEAARAEATVLGYDAGGQLATLREGSGAFTCLADDPSDDDFHVSCYHTSLEPFMQSGRALRAEGYEGAAVDSLRTVQLDAGAWSMPDGPAALYSVSGPADAYDYAAGAPVEPGETDEGLGRLHVLYVPYATVASTGLPERAGPGTPWLMESGEPWAHVMVVAPDTSGTEAEE